MNLARVVASAGGIGYAPKAPGTFGALLGVGLAALLLPAGHGVLVVCVVAITGLGLVAVRKSGSAGDDPGWVVIDEVAGQMLALLALSHVGVLGLALGFAAFRLFDIWKPGPVGWADAVHNEWGVMGDDIIAGLLAFAVLAALRLVLPL
ncbi:MAG: phosphatidylglycerophosphatase A [Acidocella sp.]|nr:phosphatidylglycerophosphatase A [Acidocella sp.]